MAGPPENLNDGTHTDVTRDLLDGDGVFAPPIWMFVDCAGQVHLVRLAEQVFDLGDRETRTRLGKKCMGGFGEVRTEGSFRSDVALL